MITITEDGGVVTLINVFSCAPENQQHLIGAWIRATENTLGRLPGIISASLHRSKDGTRVVNSMPSGRAARTGKTSSALAVNPGFGKWASTPSRTPIFTRSATSWTKQKARGDL